MDGFCSQGLGIVQAACGQRICLQCCAVSCAAVCRKMFEGPLEENGALVPHIHSVVKLHSLVTEEAGISIIIDEDELDLVDAVYIDTRYPSGLGLLPSGFPTKEDAREILGIAEKVYKEIYKRLLE